jgi:hypothetical protein
MAELEISFPKIRRKKWICQTYGRILRSKAILIAKKPISDRHLAKANGSSPEPDWALLG